MLVRTALALASRGLSVFPLLPRGKRPAVPGGLKAATTNPDEIKTWWRDQPDYNVGVQTSRRLEEMSALPPKAEIWNSVA